MSKGASFHANLLFLEGHYEMNEEIPLQINKVCLKIVCLIKKFYVVYVMNYLTH